MLLLDYFAARIMQSLCRQYDFSDSNDNDIKQAGDSPYLDILADFSYSAAACMMYARHKALNKHEDESVDLEEKC